MDNVNKERLIREFNIMTKVLEDGINTITEGGDYLYDRLNYKMYYLTELLGDISKIMQDELLSKAEILIEKKLEDLKIDDFKYSHYR